MPTQKQEDLDQRDEELDSEMADEELDVESEDEAASEAAQMNSPMGSALDAEDAKKGDVHIDEDESDEDIGEDATD
ncbi:MAG: hypothetical protein HOV81_39430 [Kofleriaceae bacterium]|nr:hypothetical protein [Kofleriaceae bacterium]